MRQTLMLMQKVLNLSLGFIKDYGVIRKILDYLGIYEFKRDRPPPKKLAVAGLFDDYAQNDYTDCDFTEF